MDSVKSLTAKALIQTSTKVTAEAIKESEKEKVSEPASKSSKRFQRNPVINEIMARKQERPKIQKEPSQNQAPALSTPQAVTTSLVQAQLQVEASPEPADE